MTSYSGTAVNDKGSPHFPNVDSDDVSVITASAKDVFKGKVLVDRLLVYYSKFGGSRSRAARYAQKLLDLGHIESLTNSRRFQDTAHVYRWTDATKLGKTKAKNGVSASDSEPTAETFGHPEKEGRHQHFEEIGKAILKISIETDNSKETEIQARIRASPRNGSHLQSQSITLGPKGVSAIAEDSFFGRRIPRTISYLTDATNDDANRAMTPFITDVTTPEDHKRESSLNKEAPNLRESAFNKNQLGRETKFNTRHIFENENDTSNCTPENAQESSSPRKQPFSKHTSLVDKKMFQSADQDQKMTLARKSATDPAIAKRLSPGANGTSEESSKVTKSEKTKNIVSSVATQSASKIKQETRNNTTAKHINAMQGSKSGNAANNTEYAKCKTECESKARNGPPVNIASTQTSEKSILEASRIFNQNDCKERGEKRSPSPAPRTLKMVDKIFPDPSVQRFEDSERKREEAKSKELQRVNRDQQQKKTRFNQEVSETSASSEITKVNGVHKREESDLVSEREMSLHSTGNADEAKCFEHMNDDSSLYIPKSPPPPSPNVRMSPTSSLAQPSSMKSLFWTKISSQAEKKRNKVLWNELEGSITFNQTEFEKLFSKPPMTSQTPRITGDNANERGSALKVLGLERSRQVSIRANTIRLPIDQIHDAIIEMDDEKLDIDALLALYDIRPTPEELDQIDDALKFNPTAILDKPEQFVLMLAMTPSLDERLRCWIFAKKFPDKIVDIQEQLLAVSEACNGIMESVTLKRVLEAILLLGNHMNKGTQRGDAYGFFLDILPKLKDVKSQNGETNLLEYVVQLVREQMKLEGRIDDQLLTPRNNESCGLPDAELLSRATAVSLPDLGDELENQAMELRECKEELLPSIVKASTIPSECETFRSKLEEFLEKATEKLRVQAQLYQDAMLTAEDFKCYYLPKVDTDTKETVLSMLRSVCDFCIDFRQQWYEIHREEVKEEFCKIQKLKRERQAEIQVRNTPSALKERFLQRRRRNVSFENERKGPEHKSLTDNTLTRTASGSNGSAVYPQNRSTAPIPKRTYKFEDKPVRDCKTPQHDQQRSSSMRSNGEQNDSYAERVNENSIRIEQRMKELHSKRNLVKYETR